MWFKIVIAYASFPAFICHKYILKKRNKPMPEFTHLKAYAALSGWLSLFWVICLPQSPACQKFSSPVLDSAMICLVNQKYEKASGMVEEMLFANPGNAEALYMLFTIKQIRILDYESYPIDAEDFILFADSLNMVFRKSLKKSSGSDSVHQLFYIGNISGAKSLMLAKSGSWFPAASEAMSSVATLKEVMKKDTTCFAAFLGIGVFDYYLSQNLGWLPFLGDRSQDGLNEISMATRAKFPYNYAAKNSLAWILIDRGELNKADSVVSSVLCDYPDNTIFLRIKARETLMRGKYTESLEAGRRLAKLSLLRNPVNWSDCLTGYQIVSESFFCMKDTAKAAKEAAYALSLEVPPAARKIPYVRKHLSYLESAAAGKRQ
jgi:hypothetical protein